MDFDLTKKDKVKVCIIISSSTGDGESPENGLNFFRFLRKLCVKKSNPLCHVYYTMLGLGSSDYSKF